MILDATCQLVYSASEVVPTVFMLRPRSGLGQWVMREEFHIHPEVPVVEYTDLYGNLCQRVVMPPGEFHVFVQYRVRVPDTLDSCPTARVTPVGNLPTEVLLYLLPSRYCQSDRLIDFAMSIVGDMAETYEQAAAIHDWIHREIHYDGTVSDSSTSALETAEGRRGVCRDFAHLGIALCRALSIPARMVVGFLHELQPMDLHAWFEAFIGGRWYTFDATQPRTTGNRIVIAYGRDAADVALATMFGNFTMLSMSVSVKPTDFFETK